MMSDPDDPLRHDMMPSDNDTAMTEGVEVEECARCGTVASVAVPCPGCPRAGRDVKPDNLIQANRDEALIRPNDPHDLGLADPYRTADGKTTMTKQISSAPAEAADFNVTKEAQGTMVLRLASLALTVTSAKAQALLTRALIELCRQGPDPVQALRQTVDDLMAALVHTERVWAEAREIAEAGGR